MDTAKFTDMERKPSMLVLVKTSVTCLLFILYMTGFYYRRPHIPVKSTRIFKKLIIAALINSLFDLITICTVNRRDVISDQVNLAAHIIYLMSILGFIYLLFLYMRSYLETSLFFSRQAKIIQSIPLILSAAGILVLPITYIHGKTTDYSLGPKAYALYGSLVIYLIMILYYCLRYWELMEGEKRAAILMAVPLYTATAVIQMIIPETLVAIVCSTLILMGLILSNENTEKYLDEKTAFFNQYSLEKVLEEVDFDKQKIVLAILCLCKMGDSLDWTQDALILQSIHRETSQYRLHGYRISENGVVFLCSSSQKAQMILEKVKREVECNYGKENLCVEIKILSEDSAATKRDCIRNIITFCTETDSRLAYVDYLTNIYNRNALERDLIGRQKEENTYYFMADLNGLKMVNDTMGHSAGDRLLQGFARLLVDTVGDDGKAYRQGGDEFAVLYEKDPRQFIEKLDRQCRKYNQSCNIPISYAIGYCPLSTEDFRDVADRMMYDDKKRIKKGGALRV